MSPISVRYARHFCPLRRKDEDSKNFSLPGLTGKRDREAVEGAQEKAVVRRQNCLRTTAP